MCDVNEEIDCVREDVKVVVKMRCKLDEARIEASEVNAREVAAVVDCDVVWKVFCG